MNETSTSIHDANIRLMMHIPDCGSRRTRCCSGEQRRRQFRREGRWSRIPV